MQLALLITHPLSELVAATTRLAREVWGFSGVGAIKLQLTVATKEIDQETARTQTIGGGVLAILLVAGIALGVLLALLITHPLSELVAATTRLARGEGEARVRPRGGRELVLLACAFNDMAAELERERAEVHHQNALLAERAAELERALAQLHEETAAREQLSATVRQLSVPIIPIMSPLQKG